MDEVSNHRNYIGGQWKAPSGGTYYPSRNPADQNDLIGDFPLSAKEDVDEAVEQAHGAFGTWSRMPRHAF